MAPGAECIVCHYKVKTPHEPAIGSEMQDLLAATTQHSAVAAAKYTSGKELSEGAHIPYFQYYEKTPDKGFEKAEAV